MKPDDIKVNMWVAIIQVLEEDNGYDYNPFWGGGRTPTLPVDGRPLQVIAISLPFVAVRDGEYRYSVDIRKYVLSRIHKTYKRMMTGKRAGGSDIHPGAAHSVEHVDTVATHQEDNRGNCPMCGERLRQVMTEHAPGVWFFRCKQCGFEGAPPATP